jgi:PAS domain S-box-containing protein
MGSLLETKLRTRLLAAFALGALATLTVSTVGYLAVSRLSAALYEVGVVRLPSIQGLDAMRESLHELARADAWPDPQADSAAAAVDRLQRMDRLWAQLDAGMQRYAPLPQTAEESLAWKRFLTDLAAWRAKYEALRRAATSRLQPDAPAAMPETTRDEALLAESLRGAERLLDDLVAINTRIAQSELERTIRTSDDVAAIGNVMIGFAGAALLLHLWLALFLGRSVTRPIEEADRALRKIAAGDLSTRVPVSGGDEVRRLAESVNHLAAALDESERARSALGANLPRSFIYQLLYEPGRGFRYIHVSPSIERLTGITPQALLADPTLLDALLLPEDRARLASARTTTAVSPLPHEYVVRAGRPGEAIRHFQISSAPRSLPDGSVVSDGIVTEITERVATERALASAGRALRTTSRCRHAVVCATDESSLLQQVCDTIVDEGGYRLCGVVYRGDDAARSVREMARAGVADNFPAATMPTWDDVPLGQGPLGAVLRTGELQRVDDVLTDPRSAPWHTLAAEAGVRSIVAFPLAENGVTFGALAIHSGEPGPWDQREVDLLTELAEDLEYGIVALRTRQRHDAAVAELRLSEERIRSTIQRSPIGVAIVDLEGNWVEVNEAMCAITGYSREEMLATAVQSLLHPEDLPDALVIFAAAAAGRIHRDETSKRFLRKDGSVIWVRIHYSVVHDAGGAPKYCVAHFVNETERHDADFALRASRARMQLTLEMSKLVYFEFDFATNLIRFDDGFREIFGWPDDDSGGVVLAPEEYTARFLFPEDEHLLARDFALARGGGAPGYGAPIEHRFRRADGTTGVLSVRRLLDRDERSADLRLRGAVQDITEMDNLRQQLVQSQKMEAIGQLAGGVAHDFNNYLTVILGYAQMLLQSLEPGDRRRIRVAAILKAAEDSASLTGQLLAFSRREVMAPRLLDLNVLVRDTETMLARLVGEDIAVTTSLEDGLARVMIDPGQMQQVLVNLAVNARDAMPRGGSLTIGTDRVVLADLRVRRFASIPAGEYVRLTVRDSGVGIPEDVQRQMFEPFFTTKGPGRGTGLGLSVVYGVLQQSGCYIDVESQLGLGTAFFIYLPCHIDPAATLEQAAPDEAAPLAGSETLLVVEDDPSIQELNREILTSQGYTVLTAADGEEALGIAEGSPAPIDLVVTDVVLPRLSGGELVVRLRQRIPGLRVLFVSGYTDDAVLRQGIAREEVEFLQKPYATAVLVRKVREILDRA